MPCRRPWDPVEEINQIFGKPITTRQTGGKNGGGAVLMPLGLALIARFRTIERAVSDHVGLCRDVAERLDMMKRGAALERAFTKQRGGRYCRTLPAQARHRLEGAAPLSLSRLSS